MGSAQGISPRQELLEMVSKGIIVAPDLTEGQLQPSSLDLRLGDKATAIRTSFLPQKTESIGETVERLKRYDFPLSQESSNMLEKGKTYVVPMQESLDLPEGFYATFNPKSTTGRADVLTRILVDKVPNFDTATPGKRTVWMEITPLSFNTRIKKGLTLGQMRVGYMPQILDEASLKLAYAQTELLYDKNKNPIPMKDVNFRDDGIELTVDLESDIVAYRAKDSSQIDYDLSGGRGSMHAQSSDFWEPIKAPKNGELVLEPNSFYLLGTYERTRIPIGICGVLQAYDVVSSEGRSHYAGFFDPGFGFGEKGEVPGTTGTLEVRMHNTPFRIVHRQPICLMKYQRMRATPADEEGNIAVYGIGKYKDSNYFNQPPGPTMGKQFLPPK